MFTAAILVGVLLFLLYAATARPRRFPPGPFNLPLVGYLPFLDRRVYRSFRDLSEIYGDVFSLNVGTFRVVVLSSFESIRDAFKEEAFAGRPDLPFLLLRSYRRGITFSQGPNWTEMRRFTVRHLRDFGFGKSTLEGMVQDEISELLGRLEEDVGHPVQLDHRFNLAVVNALWTITTGRRFSQDDYDASASAKSISEAIGRLSHGGPAEFMPFLTKFGPLKKDLDERVAMLTTLRALIADAVDRHKETHTSGDESDFVHVFLENMTDDRSEASFRGAAGDLNLRVVMQDLFIAGTETTSTSLLWLVLLLSLHPDVQEKVQREIDAQVPRTQLPSMEHRPRLPYTEAVIKESMRYVSLTPLGLFHCAVRDTDFRGYRIPKGTILFANLHQVHHSPDHWQRPNDFYPEHFLDPDGQLNVPAALIPFSIGKRSCLGESLARMELFLFTAALFQKFTFKLPAGEPVPSLEPAGAVVLSPRPYRILIELRK
nr:CYP370C8 protein [Diaphanosoma celebensis]